MCDRELRPTELQWRIRRVKFSESGEAPVASPAPSAIPLTGLAPLRTDTFTNSVSQHATEVEPSAATFGATIVIAFQIGRWFQGGGAAIVLQLRSTTGPLGRSRAPIRLAVRASCSKCSFRSPETIVLRSGAAVSDRSPQSSRPTLVVLYGANRPLPAASAQISCC